MERTMATLLVPLDFYAHGIVRGVEIELSDLCEFSVSFAICVLAWSGYHLDRAFGRGGDGRTRSVWRPGSARDGGWHFATKALVTG